MLNQNVWDGYIKPGKIFGNLYFVGTRPASTHLIDTGSGLILIDPGYRDSLYLVIQNIWEMGFDPKEIKYILLSHGHSDHMNATNALVHLCGAKTWIGKEDLPLVRGEVNHLNVPLYPFQPDVLLSDGDLITLGNTKIKCVATPGHTDGTMSFFFDVTDGNQTYRAGMHGGVGTNTLTSAFLTRNHLPFENRTKYLNSLKKVAKEKVDIFIGNHVGNNDTEDKLNKAESSEKNPFIDPGEWPRFLALRRAKLEQLIEREKKEGLYRV